MTRSARWACLVLGLWASAWAWEATAAAQPRAATLTHAVKKGDTLELLAAEYYGDRRDAIFIRVENGITRPRPLRPGERLRIPMDREITASAGDTLASLAKAHLGDERRAPLLAEVNKLSAGASLAAGQTLRIPFFISHLVTAKDTLANLAATYLGSSRRAEVLAAYNFVPNAALTPGATIIIPIYQVHLSDARRPAPDPASRARQENHAAMQKRASERLPDARAAWEAGNYAAAKKALTDLDIDYLDTAKAVDVAILLGSVEIAFGKPDEALALFRRALSRAPHHLLRAYQSSPKICAVWKQAGGAIDRKR